MVKNNNQSSLKKYKSFLLPVLLVSFIIFSYNYLLGPKIAGITELAVSTKENEEKLSRLTEKLALLEKLDKNDLQKQSETLLKALPENKQPMKIIKSVSIVSSEAGINLKSIEVLPGIVSAEEDKKSKEDIPSLNYDLSISGEFDQIVNWLNLISKTIPLLRLERVSFNWDNKRLDSTGMELKAYYYFLPETLGKIDASIPILSEEELAAYDRIKNFSAPLSIGEPLELIPTNRNNPFL